MADDLFLLSATEVVQLLSSEQISIHNVLDSLERRIEDTDSTINALPTRCFERARMQADNLESLPPAKRGPLAGLPVSIKDLAVVSGVRTTFGSMVYRDFVPARSDQLVRRIERQGGVVYAKSNTPEFGTGGITFNDVFGITRSPRNTRYASGGSSGGAAAALAAGSAWLSHGSDMAGSLRTPAAFCGVCSLRPSPGKIVADSEFMPFDILAADGPMARNIEDLAMFADVMMTNTAESMSEAVKNPMMPSRVAISEDLGITRISHEILDGFHKFVDSLGKNGISLAEASPELTAVDETFDVLRAHSYAISLQQTLADFPDTMKPEVVWNIESGLSLTADRIRQATRNQGQIINLAAGFMKDYDLLICPATSVLSVEAELRYPGSDGDVPIPDYYRWLAIAYATTVTALPVITLPFGLGRDAMPIAIQLVGKPGGEARLFQFARAIEDFTGWSAKPVSPVVS